MKAWHSAGIWHIATVAWFVSGAFPMKLELERTSLVCVRRLHRNLPFSAQLARSSWRLLSFGLTL